MKEIFLSVLFRAKNLLLRGFTPASSSLKKSINMAPSPPKMFLQLVGQDQPTTPPPPPPNHIIRIAIKQLSKRSNPNLKREVYEISYEDGVVITDTLVNRHRLSRGFVEWLPTYHFCGTCSMERPHAYYRFHDDVRCLFCDNSLGHNDNRSLAKVIRLDQCVTPQQ